MDRACSTQGSKKECIQDFGGKARRKETTKKDLDAGGKIILSHV
jgi:hypothetical protein